MSDYPSPSKFRAAANKRIELFSRQTGHQPGDRRYGASMYPSHEDGPAEDYVPGFENEAGED